MRAVHLLGGLLLMKSPQSDEWMLSKTLAPSYLLVLEFSHSDVNVSPVFRKLYCYSGDERVSCGLCVCVVGRGLAGRVWPCDGCVSHPVFSFSGRLWIARREPSCVCSCACCGSWVSAGRKRGVSWKSRRSKYDAPHTEGCDRETHKRAGKYFKFTSLFLPVLTLHYTISSSEHAAPAHTASRVPVNPLPFHTSFHLSKHGPAPLSLLTGFNFSW